jgi:hypothetical protein
MCVYRTFSELGLLIFIGMNTLIIWCSYSFQYVGRKRFFIFWLLISCLCDSLRRRGRSPVECDLTSSISVCKFDREFVVAYFDIQPISGILLCTFSPNCRRDTIVIPRRQIDMCWGDRMDILTASPSSYWLLWNLRLRIVCLISNNNQNNKCFRFASVIGRPHSGDNLNKLLHLLLPLQTA